MTDNFEYINEFFHILPSDKLGEEIFVVLKKIINFESGYIFFTNPKRLEYSYNPAEQIDTNNLKEDLKIKNTVFGEIIITGNFNKTDKMKFKTCSLIISNLIKDHEVSKIMNMQVEALQNGYEEISRYNKKLEKAEQLKSKFISYISHELRTPLNSILGFSDLIELTGQLNEKQKDYINDIKVAGLNLLQMINEILDMSKIEADALKLCKKDFETDQIIFETLNLIRPLLIKKGIKVEQDIENFIINADYQKLQQVLLNLLSNAIKFTPEKGKITIKLKQSDNKILLSVKDNGTGIAKVNQQKIFDKFEQAGQTNESSTGLGLTIANELVKMHNGTIRVNSEINKGSEFIIEIPQKTC